MVKDQVNIVISRDLCHSSDVLLTLLKSLGVSTTLKNCEYGVCDACLRAK